MKINKFIKFLIIFIQLKTNCAQESQSALKGDDIPFFSIIPDIEKNNYSQENKDDEVKYQRNGSDTDSDFESEHAETKTTDSQISNPLVAHTIIAGGVKRGLKRKENNSENFSSKKPKSFICQECDKLFIYNYHLTEHAKVHTGEKPYKCDIEDCTKAFVYKSDLNRHKKTHFKNKGFKCDFQGCGKSYTLKANLNKHKTIHSDKMDYKCDFEGCSKAFATKYKLTVHKRIHTGEKPFKCNFDGCLKSFPLKDNLNKHVKTHKK